MLLNEVVNHTRYSLLANRAEAILGIYAHLALVNWAINAFSHISATLVNTQITGLVRVGNGWDWRASREHRLPLGIEVHQRGDVGLPRLQLKVVEIFVGGFGVEVFVG